MKQYIVMGAGRFGTAVATTLLKAGQEVMVIDQNEEAIQAISEIIDNVAILDVSDESALKSIGLGNFDVAIVAIGTNLRSSVIATLLAKELGVKEVISKASDKVQADVLRRIGADRVVFPEYDMGEKLGISLAYNKVYDFMKLDNNHSIFQLNVPKNWVGQSTLSLNLRENYNVNIVGLQVGDKCQVPIDPSTIFQQGDVIIVAGNTNAIERIANMA